MYYRYHCRGDMRLNDELSPGDVLKCLECDSNRVDVRGGQRARDDK